MNEAEIKKWLGFPASDTRRLRPEIVAGMSDVACPPDGPTDEHVRVFAAFLRCAGRAPIRHLWEVDRAEAQE